MKKLFLLAFLVVSAFLAGCGSTSSSSGTGTGSGSGQTFTGKISGDKYRDHKISFRTNQQLSVNMEASNKSCYFNVLTPSGEAIHNGSINGNSFSATTSFDGYYTVRVYLMGAANSNNEVVNYTVRYSVK